MFHIRMRKLWGEWYLIELTVKENRLLEKLVKESITRNRSTLDTSLDLSPEQFNDFNMRRIIKENVVSSFTREETRKEEPSLSGGAVALAARVSGYEFVVENSLYSRNGEDSE